MRILLLSILYLINLTLSAQQPEEQFTYYHFFHNKEGLFTDKINDIEQDVYGNLWLATSDGLFMYDGSTFDNFEREKNQCDLIHSNILCLLKDHNNNIWVGCNKGLFFYDTKKAIFSTIGLNNQSSYVSSITEDTGGTIWVNTHDGIFSINSNQQKPTPTAVFKNYSYAQFICKQYQKPASYLVTPSHIYFIEATSNKVVDAIKYSNETSNQEEYLNTSAIFSDSIHLWIAHPNGGLYQINIQNKSIQYFALSVTSNRVNALYSKNNQLYICVDDTGILTFNKNNNQFESFEVSQNNHLPSYKVSKLFIDKENNFWLGIDKNGLALTNKHYNYFKFNTAFFDNNHHIVSSILKDHQGNTWIGTDGGGIYVLDAQKKQIHRFKNDPTNPNSISNNAIQCLFQDSQQRIWVGTFKGGLSLYLPVSNQFKNFNNQTSPQKSLLKNDVRKIDEDQNGNLWLAVHGKGVSSLQPTTETFTHYNNIPSLWTNDVMVCKNGTVWIATSAGIFRKLTNEKTFRNISESINALNESYVNCLYEDKNGTVWFGTLHGLYYYNPNQHIFEEYIVSKTLSNASIKSINQDPSGHLLVASNIGFFKINTSQKNYLYFNKEDGLQQENFIINASCLTNQHFYLGTSNGYCWFDINAPITLNTKTAIYIRDININQQNIYELNDFENIGNLYHLSTLDLDHDQNNLLLRFAYPTFIQGSKKSLLEYRIKEINKEWSLLNKEMELSFFGLNPGTYTIELRTLNSTNKLESFTFCITIHPPFYATWWFKCFIVIALILLLYYYYTNKTKNLIAQNKLLELKIDERTQEISQQNLILSKQSESLNQANKTKDTLLTLIAHDLKNPFTSILSQSNYIYNNIHSIETSGLKTMIHEVYQSSKNALALLDNLLTWAKAENLNDSFAWLNPKNSIQNIINEFETSALNKKIKINVINENEFETLIDKNIFETILRNLLHNAIKFSYENGTINIHTSTTQSLDGFILYIQDNGIGLSQQDLDKINQLQLPSRKEGTMNEKSTGFGLSILYDLFLSNNITLKVESEINKGAVFTLTFLNQIKTIDTLSNSFENLTSNDSDIEIQISHSPYDLKNKKILIVDDHENIRYAVGIHLKKHFTIYEASNGKEAIELANTLLPDLIISDVRMPEMDGFELNKYIKNDALTTHIPFVFLTAQDTEQDIINGLKMGVDDYILKPFNPEILLLKIYNLLNTRELLKTKYKTEQETTLENIAHNRLDQKLLIQLNELIQKNISNEEFTVEQLSVEMGMHRSNLTKKITALTGLTPNEVIKTQRMKLAASMFTQTDKNISEVAYDCGYSDPKYFSKVFKGHYGLLPSEFISINRP
jgi:ligand-binding sensor domain-containing protein/signal transduction histidine kinase/DNA-binding response OmpR family regulator